MNRPLLVKLLWFIEEFCLDPGWFGLLRLEFHPFSIRFQLREKEIAQRQTDLDELESETSQMNEDGNFKAEAGVLKLQNIKDRY